MRTVGIDNLLASIEGPIPTASDRAHLGLLYLYHSYAYPKMTGTRVFEKMGNTTRLRQNPRQGHGIPTVYRPPDKWETNPLVYITTGEAPNSGENVGLSQLGSTLGMCIFGV